MVAIAVAGRPRCAAASPRRRARSPRSGRARSACGMPRLAPRRCRSASNAGSPTASPASAALGHAADLRQPRRRHRRPRVMPCAMILPVGDVVARAAPGVEQPGPLARRAVEQPAGGGEALRSARDRFPRGRDDRARAVGGTHRSLALHPGRSACVGTCAAILSSSASSVSSTISRSRCCGRTKPTSPIFAQKAISSS